MQNHLTLQDPQYLESTDVNDDSKKGAASIESPSIPTLLTQPQYILHIQNCMAVREN